MSFSVKIKIEAITMLTIGSRIGSEPLSTKLLTVIKMKLDKIEADYALSEMQDILKQKGYDSVIAGIVVLESFPPQYRIDVKLNWKPGFPDKVNGVYVRYLNFSPENLNIPKNTYYMVSV